MRFSDVKQELHFHVRVYFMVFGALALALPAISKEATNNPSNNPSNKPVGTVAMQSKETSHLEISFDDVSELNNWIIVNDTVMGGRSRAQLALNEEGLGFSGTLSLENNGGFASIRRVYQPKDWLSEKAIQITVIGDGRPYQFRLRTNRRVDDVAYVANFNTVKDKAISLTFSESDFTAQFRGRLVSRAPALDFENIEQLGIMLADKSPGDFAITVVRIEQLK